MTLLYQNEIYVWTICDYIWGSKNVANIQANTPENKKIEYVKIEDPQISCIAWSPRKSNYENE